MRTPRPIRYDATVAGYLGVDLTPGFPQSGVRHPLAELLRPGKLLQTDGLEISLGGAVANTGLAMKHFGCRVALMGLIGHDTLGDIVLARLRRQGVTTSIRRTRQAGTAYGIVLAPPGTDRMFLEDPGCNSLFSSRDIDYQTVGASRLFHFGYPTLMAATFAHEGVELVRIFSRVKRLGVATSMDTTLPDPDSAAGHVNWCRILATVLPHVDIFVPSIEEILAMMEPKTYRRLLRKVGSGDIIDTIPRELYSRLANRLLALGVRILLIKAGHRGAYLRTGNLSALTAATPIRLPLSDWNHREAWIDAQPTSPSRFKNACGAGDCAVAALLAAILAGETPDRAGRLAMIAGRDNLYGADSLEGLRPWTVMRKELSRRHT